jgi:hypothetical protein
MPCLPSRPTQLEPPATAFFGDLTARGDTYAHAQFYLNIHVEYLQLKAWQNAMIVFIATCLSRRREVNRQSLGIPVAPFATNRRPDVKYWKSPGFSSLADNVEAEKNVPVRAIRLQHDRMGNSAKSNEMTERKTAYLSDRA